MSSRIRLTGQRDDGQVAFRDEVERPVAREQLDEPRPATRTERDGARVEVAGGLEHRVDDVAPVADLGVGVGERLAERRERLLGLLLALLDRRLVGDATALLDDVDDRHPLGGVAVEHPSGGAGVVRVRDGDERVNEETHGSPRGVVSVFMSGNSPATAKTVGDSPPGR